MFERYTTFPIQPEYRHFAFLYKMDLDPIFKIPSTDLKISQIILDHIGAVFLGKMGRSLNYQYSIELLSNIPIKSKMRRYSDEDQKFIDETLEELLKLGVIERATECSYVSQILVVHRGKKPRLCMDFRELNSITRLWKSRMVDIKEIFAEHKGMIVFGIIDLKSAYWQIPIIESDVHKTGFNGGRLGQYVWKGLPFGLVNAPALFQSITDNIVLRVRNHLRLLGLQDKCKITGYLDDFAISAIDNKHFYIVMEILMDEIEKEGLKIGIDKCQFMQDEIIYLGHRLNSSGIHLGPGKMKAIEEYPVPRDVKELRKYYGLVSYSRKFIRNFAQITKPLAAKFKEENVWSWTEEDQGIFDHIKKTMQEEPSLRHFIPGLKTIVMTDASYKGIGGVLMQIEEGANKPHLCDCFSRNLNISEQKLHIDQLEAIALKEALLERFDMYIRGHSPKPICYTDNNPLVMAAKKLKPARSYEFCVMEIQNMLPHIDLRHIKGESNRIADALSRAPVELARDSPFECTNTTKP